MKIAILQPVVVLIVWTLFIWAWMYATRIPAMQKAGIVLDPTVPPRELTASLPASVRWKADNYNHLMEQPTLFYATALVIAVLDGGAGGAVVWAAWGYVGLRVVHSVVQVTTNRIMLRFGIFLLSTLCLMVMAGHAFGLALIGA